MGPSSFWNQCQGRTPQSRACTKCTSEGGSSNSLCLKRVTSLHLFTSPILCAPAHKNKGFILPKLSYCHQNRLELLKKVEWCNQVNVTPASGHGECFHIIWFMYHSNIYLTKRLSPQHNFMKYNIFSLHLSSAFEPLRNLVIILVHQIQIQFTPLNANAFSNISSTAIGSQSSSDSAEVVLTKTTSSSI